MEGGATGSMTNIISQLTTGITTSTIFGVVGEVMPFVITMIIVSFGFYVLRRVIKGAGKAKARV